MLLSHPPKIIHKVLLGGTKGLNCRIYRSVSKMYVNVTHSKIGNIKYLIFAFQYLISKEFGFEYLLVLDALILTIPCMDIQNV